MRAYERFLQYVQVYTTSDPDHEGTTPSSPRQFDLARRLADELKALGVQDVRLDEHCYVFASLPATSGSEKAPAMGFLAHMDTTPDAPGEHVTPVLHPYYDGGDVALPNGRVIDVATYPAIKVLKGKTLITASGDTLLGADDKAGIAEIMTLIENIVEQHLPHGKLCFGFTPDEEIGAGTACFDVKAFGADFAYTVDGHTVNSIEYETFNASKADVWITGVEVHPGEAKNIMVNALQLAREFDGMLPEKERPEHTEGREGFYLLHKQQGTVSKAHLEYILRDHSSTGLKQRHAAMDVAAKALRERYPKAGIALHFAQQYRNMAEVVEQYPHLIEAARHAIHSVGLEPETLPVRGGTDGSNLSFMGLPCPNLGTGAFYCHGPNECIAAEDMDTGVQVLLAIVAYYAGRDKMDL